MAGAVTGSLGSGVVAFARQDSTPGGCTAADCKGYRRLRNALLTLVPHAADDVQPRP